MLVFFFHFYSRTHTPRDGLRWIIQSWHPLLLLGELFHFRFEICYSFHLLFLYERYRSKMIPILPKPNAPMAYICLLSCGFYSHSVQFSLRFRFFLCYLVNFLWLYSFHSREEFTVTKMWQCRIKWSAHEALESFLWQCRKLLTKLRNTGT